MAKVSNSDLMGVLLDIKSDIGALKQASSSHTAWMTKHVEDDKAMADDIRQLQLGVARQRGAVRVLAAVATAAGAAIGYFMDILLRQGH